MNSVIAIGLLLVIIGAVSATERPYTILWCFTTPLFYILFGFKSLYVPLGFTDVELFSGMLPMMVFLITWMKLTPTERRRAWKYSPKLWWLFLAYYFVSLTWSVRPSTGVRTVLELAFPSLLYLVAFNVVQSDRHLAKYYRWMVIINVSVAIVDVYSAFTGWASIAASHSMEEGAIGYRTVSAYFYATMSILLLTERMVRFRFSYLLLVLLDITLLLLAASRTPTFVFIAGLGIAVLYRRDLKFTVIGSVGMGVLLLMIFVLPTRKKFLSSDDSLNMKDSGRSFFQKYFEDKATERPVFGFGAGGTEWYATWITNHITMVGAPHNEYLRVRFDSGIVGLSLFWLGLADMLVLGLKLGSKLKAYFPFRAILVMTPVMFALSCTNDNTFFYFYVFTSYLFVFMGFGARLSYEEQVIQGSETLTLTADERELIFKGQQPSLQ